MIPGKLEYFVEDRFFAVHIGDLVSIDDPVLKLCPNCYKAFFTENESDVYCSAECLLKDDS